LIGNGLAVQLIASACVKLEVTGQRMGVSACLLGWFAAVALLNGRELFGVLSDFARQLHQQATTLGGTQLAPLALQAFLRGAHSGVDVGGIAALNLRKNLPVGRVKHGDQQAAARSLRRIGYVIQLHGSILRSSHAPSLGLLAIFCAANQATYL
jgi:hypothetical protein